MTNLSKIKSTKYIGQGIYMNDDTEYKKAVKEDYNNTVKANPDKKYIFDPFCGYIEINEYRKMTKKR